MFRTEVESRTAESVTYRSIATEREPPSDEWSLLAGEAIQNLRASLDHVVWASAAEDKRSQQTAFPICTDPRNFQVSGAHNLKGVPEPVRAVIEKAQPYRTSPQALPRPCWSTSARSPIWTSTEP